MYKSPVSVSQNLRISQIVCLHFVNCVAVQGVINVHNPERWGFLHFAEVQTPTALRPPYAVSGTDECLPMHSLRVSACTDVHFPTHPLRCVRFAANRGSAERDGDAGGPASDWAARERLMEIYYRAADYIQAFGTAFGR
eukprot:1512678-Rhodomonas_salina.1